MYWLVLLRGCKNLNIRDLRFETFITDTVSNPLKVLIGKAQRFGGSRWAFVWFSILIMFGEKAIRVLKMDQVEVLESFFVVGS